ncbi:LLM class flavin-dependent oxidoreductase [Actinomadura parmotrematis]|uniref:LLM class flavin-dependent oxidoreductase n=1 Tax=Actinomadura parmotrematis TaxID=2864039 RepID=A0ABS7G3H6_9ACTN|nr:LLM class flavin-dependent oxidoreductase [Actinomadura parmotrematis]MBW8486780.1 LLM class flavin-dependent oxidoreductase [Actinomadura parmotrematis]
MTTVHRDHVHLAVALDGAGWHPAAWREASARPAELFSARYWSDLVAEAERGLLDLVTFEDLLGQQSSRLEGPDGRTDQVRGRLDAVLLAARLATVTSHIGLVPATSVTHTEPFHVGAGIASLDHATNGRAGWRPQITAWPHLAAHFGRRTLPDLDVHHLQAPGTRETVAELFAEAADAVEVVRRLWDSWEDGAEIRDAATGRFIDRDKLHYIDFQGAHFSVRGPSITPRSPQGQPLVTALAHDRVPYEFAARSADVVYTTPHSRADAAAIIAEVEEAAVTVGRTGEPLRVFADLLVFVGADAAARKERLDELDGAPLASDALIVAGTAAELADLIEDWRGAGVDGFRLRPGGLPHDLAGITGDLVPELQRRGIFRTAYAEATLRERFGLARPASRYAAAS